MSMSRGAIAALSILGLTCLAAAQAPSLVAPSSPGAVPPPSASPMLESPRVNSPSVPPPTPMPPQGFNFPGTGSQPAALENQGSYSAQPPMGNWEPQQQPFQPSMEPYEVPAEGNYSDSSGWTESSDWNSSAQCNNSYDMLGTNNYGFDGLSGGLTYDGYELNAGAGLASPPPLGLIAPESGTAGTHTRYPFYSYRRPWYYPGPASQNVTIVW